jgi:hypothetical protein
MPCKEDLLRVNETYDYEERIGIHIDDNTGDYNAGGWVV